MNKIYFVNKYRATTDDQTTLAATHGVPISIAILSCTHNLPVKHSLSQQVTTSSSQYFCCVIAIATSPTCLPGHCGHGGWGCARHAIVPSPSSSLCCMVGMPLQCCHLGMSLLLSCQLYDTISQSNSKSHVRYIDYYSLCSPRHPLVSNWNQRVLRCLHRKKQR